MFNLLRKKPKMNKTQFIMHLLKSGKRVSHLSLLDECRGDMRLYTTELRKRVSEFRAKGIPIKKEMVTSGNGARYAEYYLEDK